MDYGTQTTRRAVRTRACNQQEHCHYHPEGGGIQGTWRARRRPATRNAMLTIAVCSLVLPGAYAQTYYENTSIILSILSQPEAWKGASYDNDGGANYLFRPIKDMSDQLCQPKTGKPSKCAVDTIYLHLRNPPTHPVSGAKHLFLNMTMLLKSNVFLNSPGAEGYFEMPHVCEYERNHSVLALFNASNGKVDFTILDTHLDSLGCHNRVPAGTEQPGVIHRCGAPGGQPQKCYNALDNKQFKGLFRLGPRRATDPSNVPHHLEIVMRFPYKVYGANSWSDFNERTKTNYIPRESEPYAITNWATQRELQIFRYSLYPWTPTQPLAFLGPNGEWFRDRRAKIERVDPPFGPQDGGTVVTIIGQEFPVAEPGGNQNASIILQHGLIDVEGVKKEWGGQARECCETKRISESQITCRLPRISCLHDNRATPPGPCPKPGKYFANQTVSLVVKPNVKGYYSKTDEIPQLYRNSPPFDSSFPDGLDDFVPYEGEWVLEDNDIYGGSYVKLQDRVPGEVHLLESDYTTAQSFCCPVCQANDRYKDNTCRIHITRERAGVYSVKIPNFLFPGGRQCTFDDQSTCKCKDRADSSCLDNGKTCTCKNKVPAGSGVCDAPTNFRNDSLSVGIERSFDPKGFTPAKALSVTSCIDQTGACKDLSRVSIRESCKQLVWSTGKIDSFLPPGQTQQVHHWKSDGKCDRRMRCVGGPCLWTTLASNPDPDVPVDPKKKTPPVFQRREASPQMGMEIQYKNEFFSSKGFLSELAKLIVVGPARDNNGDVITSPPGGDARRLQILYEKKEKNLPMNLLSDRKFAVREFQKSESALCIPEAGSKVCVNYTLIVYITSDGPNGNAYSVPQAELMRRARLAQGDPDLRRLNLMKLCVDQSWDPKKAEKGAAPECIKVQYPGFLQFERTQVRTKEDIWSYAKIGVTRTGGSDLDVTVDYNTVELKANGTGDRNHYAVGLGVDFTSKQGQLIWLEGDSATKYVIVPIRWDGITERSETFQVKIDNAVNAKLMTEPNPQWAMVTIVGINDTPEPRFIANMQMYMGLVCGAATAVPCALLSARLVRSFNRKVRKKTADEDQEQDQDDDQDFQ